MRAAEAHPGGGYGRQHFRPPPGKPTLWATLLTGALLAGGFGWRRYGSEDARIRQALDEREGPQDRGRFADSPSEIPARGWKDIIVRIYKEIGDDRVVPLAAGVTYYALLAIFPAIAALVSIFGLFADTAVISEQLRGLSSFIPAGAIEVIEEQLRRLASQGEQALGLTFVTGLLLSLWSSNAGMKALFDSLNIVYDEIEKRSFIRLNAISLAFTFGAIVFIMLALFAVVVLPVALKFVGLERQTEFLLTVLRWPAIFVVVAFAVALIYRHGPSREKAKWRWLTWGSVVASLLWIGVSMLFSWYATNFGNYNETYGSLGAVVGFMVWIWLSTITVLLGAELDAEMEHQTAKDTTEGPPKPLGARGATMADTIGPAQTR